MELLPKSFDHHPLLDACDTAEHICSQKRALLLDYFLIDAEHYIRRMEKALLDQNAIALVPPAHMTHTTSSALGMRRLSKIAAEIEQQAHASLQRKGDMRGMATTIHQLRFVFEQTRAALKPEPRQRSLTPRRWRRTASAIN